MQPKCKCGGIAWYNGRCNECREEYIRRTIRSWNYKPKALSELEEENLYGEPRSGDSITVRQMFELCGAKEQQE